MLREASTRLADGGSVCVSNQMKHLEIDVANATENPLFVPKTRAGEASEATASSSSSTTTTSDEHAHVPNRVVQVYSIDGCNTSLVANQ